MQGEICATCEQDHDLHYLARHKLYYCAPHFNTEMDKQINRDLRLQGIDMLDVLIDRLFEAWAKSHLSSVRPSQRITQRGNRHEMARA